MPASDNRTRHLRTSRVIPVLGIEDHAHCTLDHLGGVFRGLSHDGSILSIEGASSNPGAVQNDYVFGTCFNSDVHENNALLFLDHCLSHLSNPFLDRDDQSYIATKAELPGGLDPKAMGRYWRQHREPIRGRELQTRQRCVFTANYIASYRDDLNGVFAVLDELADEANPASAGSDELQPTSL